MKKNKNYDEKIKISLKNNADEIEASDELFYKIVKNIKKQESEKNMRKKSKKIRKGKRIAVMVASLILVGSLTVMGITVGRNWIGHSNLKYNTFPSEEKVLKDIGFSPKYPKSLPGGFEFYKGGTGKTELLEAENVLTEIEELNLRYKRENEKSGIDLSIGQIDEKYIDKTDSELVGKINGVDLYYYNKDYKFVPADYELTEEDRKAKELGVLEISYGAAEIEFNNIQGISWYEDGLEYMIMASDYNFTIEEMIHMAEVVIQE